MRTDAPRDPRRPEPGYYTVRLVSKGWPVPARLDLAGGVYTLELDGAKIDDSWTAEQLEALVADYLFANEVQPIARLALFGRPCPEWEYQYRLRVKEWATRECPSHPCLAPRVPMRAGRLSPTVHFPE